MKVPPSIWHCPALAMLHMLSGMQHAPIENGVQLVDEQLFSAPAHFPFSARQAVSLRLPQSPSGVQQAPEADGQEIAVQL